MKTHIQDLHTLLQNAGEKGPFIFVGHSMGGIQLRMYYQRYPEDVRGIVLVESSIEGMYQHLPSIIEESNRSAGSVWTFCEILAPVGVIRLAGLGNSYANAFPTYSDEAKTAIQTTFNRSQNCKGMAWETALTSVFDSGEPFSLGDVPLIVLTRGLDDVQANPNQRFTADQVKQFQQVQADWLVLQEQLAKLSTNSKQIIADQSGHFIQANQPDLVVNAIHDMIAMSQQ
jgi:pimeloyl-ACP methyl ester carboxylesterase